MIKYLMVSVVLIAGSSQAFAHVTTMTNNELDEVALPTQSQAQLQPVLPQYDSNGQIGTVATEINPISTNGMQGIRVETSSAPVMPALPPAVVAQLNQIFNIASQNR
ncbi:MAG: hypothetical protein KGO49_04085 [Gammaproteobacteria bacterium]|nr:hypothetical protein [Gammaproteobacteria bacterium]